METTQQGDPKSLYPTPPFKKQDQEPPGQSKLMDPYPDHGEYSYKGNKLLQGMVVVITGADSGIGKATAIAMAREGADIIIGFKEDIEQEDADDTADWVRKAGREAILFKGDIRQESICQQLIEMVVGKFKKIDVLINNAAYQMSYKKIEDISAEEWNKTFEVNLSAMFYLTKHAKPHLRTGGSIINTTSVNAYDPNPTLLPYAASKAAIQNFTSNLAQQFLEEGLGIRVNAVAPGPVWTPLIPSTIPDHEKFGANTPMGRPGQPAEIAPVYVFLASAAASYISGATIPVTGGRITI
ncbi:SDR family oxidoreductase [Sphingobacterium humi]|uniref:SDR family oxidoreductase n=1 Tax=Sphingobacterium humi TaxID=1796905 RepID=A0A6N8KUC5_9SPHI|nr:SDR family oxidoreductase [Sphingobacterium humi]MVZ60666.1 SDR family oxidoreductase [Sphingobacterium humi]